MELIKLRVRVSQQSLGYTGSKQILLTTTTSLTGVCVSSSSCKDSGGETIDGACPDSADVKCCTKPSCSDNSKGNCRWTSDCDGGKEESGLCPGPAAVKCCMSDKEGFGGYDPPDIPSGNGCEKVTTTGAQKIVDQFPGRVREVFCTRDCECNPPDSSDHCCGKASDMMCSDEGSVSSRASYSRAPVSQFIAMDCVSSFLSNTPIVYNLGMASWLIPRVDTNYVWPGNRRMGHAQPGRAEPEVRHLGSAHLGPVSGQGSILARMACYGRPGQRY